MSDSKPVRFAIIGCGSIASNGYQPRLLTYPKKVAIHGYFDKFPASAEKLNAAAGGKGKLYQSVEEVLADPDIEAILNTTTIEGHYAVSLAALKAGKHVYSEKPIAITSPQAAELLAEAKKRNLKIACAPSSALGYEQQDVWRRIRAGEIGTPHTVFGTFACTRLEAWHANADVFMTNGTSVVADAAPYPLTCMTTFFGPIARVYGSARIIDPVRTLRTGPREGAKFTCTIPNMVIGILEFTNGMRGFINTGWSGRSETPPLEIHGTERAITLNPHNDGAGIRTWSQYSSEITPLPTPEKAMKNALDWGKGPVDLADAIRNNRPVRCSPAQAAHIVEIAEALNASSASGQAIALTTTFDPPAPVGEVAPWESA
ncbi:MAG TPA: Gfo/Idh/MocA family oxidoreductase [Planctomycetota bacterium]|nr:Gfo/Idh/MocA family oxidoreductase [Planctomycetota bacterium]